MAKGFSKKRSYSETHKIINDMLYKICYDCDCWFLLNKDNFHKNNVSKDGFMNYCKKCNLIRLYAWQDNNRDKMKAAFIKCDSSEKRKEIKRKLSKERNENGKYDLWAQNDKEKTNQYSKNRGLHKLHKISKNEWRQCKEYFDNLCAYCGIGQKENYELYNQDFCKDHFDNDGSNDIKNCVPACKGCNGKKWMFEFSEWYNKENPIFSFDRLEKILSWIEYINN